MKYKIISLFLILSISVFSQTKEKIFLEWKITKNDTLKYKTIMNDTRDKSFNQDSTSLFFNKEFDEKLQSLLTDIDSSMKYQTKLFLNKNGKAIDIETVALSNETQNIDQLTSQNKPRNKKERKKKKEYNQKELDTIKDFFGLNNRIVLRGRISSSGEIISTYYKNSQKNLIALLFELPNKEIEIGEKWKVNVNFIEMDQDFVCDSLSNENYVYIEKVFEKDDQKIAVVKYIINEYVIGDFSNPLIGMFGIEKDKKTYMKVSYNATGNFSITKGKWISYQGIMEGEGNFLMLGGKNVTEFKLDE